MNLTDARTDADAAADAGPAGPSDESELETSETNVADTDASDLEPGAATYRVVDELDATGRMTLRTEDGTERRPDRVVVNADYAHAEQELMPEHERQYDADYWDERTYAPSAATARPYSTGPTARIQPRSSSATRIAWPCASASTWSPISAAPTWPPVARARRWHPPSTPRLSPPAARHVP